MKLLSAAGGLALGPEGVRAVPVPQGTLGVVVRSTNGAPVVAAMRADSGADMATVYGAVAPSSRWLVLPAVGPSGGRSAIVLVNPGSSTERVTLRLLGRNGPVADGGDRTVEIPAGRTIVVKVSGKAPISVVVTAAGGTVVAAAMLGQPMPGGKQHE